LLSVRNLVVADPAAPGRAAVRDFSVDIHAREVVGIYGLMGAGRTELLERLAGQNPVQAGTVELDGIGLQDLSIEERIEAGLVLVPEDRQRDGLIQGMGIGANMALGALRRFIHRGLLSLRGEREATREMGTRVRLKSSGLAAPIGSLSGGRSEEHT